MKQAVKGLTTKANRKKVQSTSKDKGQIIKGKTIATERIRGHGNAWSNDEGQRVKKHIRTKANRQKK